MTHSQEYFHRDLERCELCGQGGETALTDVTSTFLGSPKYQHL